MKKFTLEEVMEKYEEIVNGEFESPSFSSYYITDNDCNVTNKKPYKLKSLWVIPISPQSKNKNDKYILSEEQKVNFKNILMETFNKENIYLLM